MREDAIALQLVIKFFRNPNLQLIISQLKTCFAVNLGVRGDIHYFLTKLIRLAQKSNYSNINYLELALTLT